MEGIGEREREASDCARGKGDTTIVERPAAPATSHHGYYHHAASLPPSLATTTVSPSMLMVHELARHRQPVHHDSGYTLFYTVPLYVRGAYKVSQDGWGRRAFLRAGIKIEKGNGIFFDFRDLRNVIILKWENFIPHFRA